MVRDDGSQLSGVNGEEEGSMEKRRSPSTEPWGTPVFPRVQCLN